MGRYMETLFSGVLRLEKKMTIDMSRL